MGHGTGGRADTARPTRAATNGTKQQPNERTNEQRSRGKQIVQKRRENNGSEGNALRVEGESEWPHMPPTEQRETNERTEQNHAQDTMKRLQMCIGDKGRHRGREYETMDASE